MAVLKCLRVFMAFLYLSPVSPTFGPTLALPFRLRSLRSHLITTLTILLIVDILRVSLRENSIFCRFLWYPILWTGGFFGLMKSIYHPFAKSIQSPGAVYWNIPEIRCSGVPCTPFGVMWHDWCHSTFPFAKLRFDQPWYLKFEKFDELRQIHINEPSEKEWDIGFS